MASRNIKKYLLELRHLLETDAASVGLRFVSGNQSCDMDSTVCALTYSYFNYLHNPTKLVIPLLNIPREELRLRKDISVLLQTHEITSDLLYFVEDLDRMAKSNSESQIEVVLVDHCNIQGDEWHRYMDEGRLKITGIVDHHEDERAALDAAPRIIRSTGSCSSLVFNYWYSQFQDKSKILAQTEVAELLLAPLLIDTSNMSQKVELPDVEALKLYKEILEKEPALVTTTAFAGLASGAFSDTLLKQYTRALKSYKKNLDGFSFFDILRKDYKSFTFTTTEGKEIRVGFSSLSSDFEYCCTVHKNDFVSGASTLLKSSTLDLLVMTASFTERKTKAYSRQFSLFFPKNSQYLELFESLPKLVNASLDLNDEIPNFSTYSDFVASVGQESGFEFKLYNQGNTAASRKQVVPAVKTAIEQ